MTRQLIGWFLLLPLCVLLIVFALANRQLVIVNFNPLASVDQLADWLSSLVRLSATASSHPLLRSFTTDSPGGPSRTT